MSASGKSSLGCSCGEMYSAALMTALPLGLSAVYSVGSRGRAGHHVPPVALAVVGCRPEPAVGVDALRPVGVLLVARPLDPAAATQLLVRHARVVARSSPAALLPALEGTLGVAPLHQRCAVLVLEAHPMGEVDEDVEVRARLTRRVDSLLGEVDGAVGVGEGPGLLPPGGGREDNVGELGGLAQSGCLHGEEQ